MPYKKIGVTMAANTYPLLSPINAFEWKKNVYIMYRNQRGDANI